VGHQNLWWLQGKILWKGKKMTTTVYLTGDRSMMPLPAANLTAIILNKLLVDHPEGIMLLTGDSNTGIERAVRYLVPEQAVQVFQRTTDDEGRVDFDTTHKQLVSQVDKVIVLHTDPLNSRLTKSVAQLFPDEKVEYPLDTVMNQAPDDLNSLMSDLLPEPPKEDEVLPPDTEKEN
jgi:hypothetical protein